jgi:hypothetical protein
VAIVAARISGTRATDKEQNQKDYSAPLAAAKADPAQPDPAATVSNAWGSPLKSLAELNRAAADTEAAFVVLSSKNAGQMAAIQKEVSAAASTITSRGSRMGIFLLSQESQEYAVLAQRVGTPAVLAMYKGRGVSAVADNQVTQEGLLRAFVASSRPSGCGPSGCGPSGCN